ncbi:hypothetical protein BUALT_Bualt01G0124700 [Buddleja alternifolia]|uniref:Uncharacterized protein n=1 Tax=Buddleja alternifolia TaxID=168488 RepID=A0AAV6Y7L3_9LAMI|nr:hypothetical protein BUALT_Bualt01G0124700 [Buddleja alternifolia]
MPPLTTPQALGIESSSSIPATRGTHHNAMGMNALKRRFDVLKSILKKDQKTSLSLFNATALEISSTSAKGLANAFAQGLSDEEFFQSLTKKLTTNFDNLLARVEKYVNMEEAARMK